MVYLFKADTVHAYLYIQCKTLKKKNDKEKCGSFVKLFGFLSRRLRKSF